MTIGTRCSDINDISPARGFSLVEVLVSLVILSIGVIGVMAVFPQAYRDVTNAGRTSTLNHLANKKMDELKTLGFGNAALSGTASPGTVHSDSALTAIPGLSGEYRYPVPDPGTTDPAGNEFEKYSLKWTVISNSPIAGISTVVIEVGYDISYNISGALLSSPRRNSQIARFQFCITSV
jgi:prepilin-type N-terminal cleavage/methylation domain-containing protein